MGGAKSLVMLWWAVLIGTVGCWPLPRQEDTRLTSLELAIIKCIVETVPGATEGGGIAWSVARSRSRELQNAGVEIVKVPMREPDFSRSGYSRDGGPDDWTLVRLTSGGPNYEEVVGQTNTGGDPGNWAIVRSISTELHLNPEQVFVHNNQPAYQRSGGQAVGSVPPELSVERSLAREVLPPLPPGSGEYPQGGDAPMWSIVRSISSEIHNKPGTPDGQPDYTTAGVNNGRVDFGGQSYQQAFQTSGEYTRAGDSVAVVQSISSGSQPIYTTPGVYNGGGGFGGQAIRNEQSYQQTLQRSGEYTRTGDSVSVVPSISRELEPVGYDKVPLASGKQEYTQTQAEIAERRDSVDHSAVLPLFHEINASYNEVGEIPARLTEISPPAEQQTDGGNGYWNSEQSTSSEHLALPSLALADASKQNIPSGEEQSGGDGGVGIEHVSPPSSASTDAFTQDSFPSGEDQSARANGGSGEHLTPPSSVPSDASTQDVLPVGEEQTGGDGGGSGEQHISPPSSAHADVPTRDILPPAEEPAGGVGGGSGEHHALPLSSPTVAEDPPPCEKGYKRIKNVCRRVYNFQLKSKVR